MTGIVREVLVAPGDVVAVGQTLFILEAMKMENEVKAQAAGTVKALGVTAGQTVTQGDVVAEIG
jgi:pyruvate carboxylase subunit B